MFININTVDRLYIENTSYVDIFTSKMFTDKPFLVIKNKEEFNKIKFLYEIYLFDYTDAYYIDNCAVLYISKQYIINIRNLLILSNSPIENIENQIKERYKIKQYKKYQNTFVTAFLNFGNKDELTLDSDYFRYFSKIAKTNIPIILFLDKKEKKYALILNTFYPNVHIEYIDSSFLLFNSNKRLPSIRNTKKDTKEYIQFMNNKIIFMNKARELNIYNTNYFIWVDFRLFHIFKNESVASSSLIDLATKQLIQKSYFPGALTIKQNKLDDVNWRFLGGVFILDSDSIIKLNQETIDLLSSDIPVFSWEVNNWAIIEYNNKFDFGWYFADHNETILDVK